MCYQLAVVISENIIYGDIFILTNFKGMFIFEVGIIRLLEKYTTLFIIKQAWQTPSELWQWLPFVNSHILFPHYFVELGKKDLIQINNYGT